MDRADVVCVAQFIHGAGKNLYVSVNDVTDQLVDRSEIVIEAGDLVLWNCPEAGATPYCVAGEKEFFANSRMVNECGYGHAFGVAGEYRWRDANGSDAHGTVRVRDPQCK